MYFIARKEDKLMSQKRKQNGFTLAELLVVIAIIGVLVAVSIPIFSSQINKAKLATNRANIRAAKAAASADYISYMSDKYVVYAYNINTGSFEAKANSGLPFNVLDSRKICWVIDNNTTDTNLFSKNIGSLFDRYNFGNSSDIYPFIIVYVTPNYIKTCPYYDSSSKTIVTKSAG